ncbi:pentapeptide repeat-containing protein [Rhodococcoides corynebacterioides]|uniref:Pentapeptide repeat-containing protein n=1 Tax=Rhodococcoides corynebacterioides TaxID=53972 RepID=A0ABS7P5R0_9NOCA|nr:pentapeptide repeat-containing protein [Rhodococcus corynebacterioides]MBY6367754.1 pentapeptide repeat-containing protein [Rhodococcus corynebacterioides]MBY6408487.1 pentapeptide repeat-containing protein [Rhodococcus corynebacterioides]
MPSLGPRPSTFRSDCRSCVALCCTAFGFTRSRDFAVDKPAGTPCRHLDSSYACTIHDSLRGRGFRGCTVFDCLGAGQAVSRRFAAELAAGPDARRAVFAVFGVVRHCHEMLWHLHEAAQRTRDGDTAEEVHRLTAVVTRLVGDDLDVILAANVDLIHAAVGGVLAEVSAEVRASYLADPDRSTGVSPGRDLAGARLRGRRLCGADLRGACLIGADLRDADLTAADLLGADLRDARLDGADLTAALFLTPSQVNAAHGDAATALPSSLSTPLHWPGQA